MSVPEPSQYDAFAAEYGAFAVDAPYNALYDRPATLALLGDVAGRTVLDAACGPGLYAEELLARGAEVVGFDGSAAMVAVARARLGERAELRVHPLAEPLGWLADDAVDLVLCALAYHYVGDRPAFLAEVTRVLRPGGALVISTTHPTDDWLRLGGSYFATDTVTETWSPGWEVARRRAPLGVLTEEFAAAGFLIERLVEPPPAPEMESSHPDVHERLTTQPGFVLFRLRPGGPSGGGPS